MLRSDVHITLIRIGFHHPDSLELSKKYYCLRHCFFHYHSYFETWFLTILLTYVIKPDTASYHFISFTQIIFYINNRLKSIGYPHEFMISFYEKILYRNIYHHFISIYLIMLIQISRVRLCIKYVICPGNLIFCRHLCIIK